MATRLTLFFQYYFLFALFSFISYLFFQLLHINLPLLQMYQNPVSTHTIHLSFSFSPCLFPFFIYCKLPGQINKLPRNMFVIGASFISRLKAAAIRCQLPGQINKLPSQVPILLLIISTLKELHNGSGWKHGSNRLHVQGMFLSNTAIIRDHS